MTAETEDTTRANRWTLDHGFCFDGLPVIVPVRAVWGEGYLPAATLDTLNRRIVNLLNEADVEVPQP